MESVATRFDLKRTTADVVFVRSINTLFVRDGDEWVIKEYFSVREASAETGIPSQRMIEWTRKLKLGNGKRFRLAEIRKLIKVKLLRENKISFKKICKLI